MVYSIAGSIIAPPEFRQDGSGARGARTHRGFERGGVGRIEIVARQPQAAQRRAHARTRDAGPAGDGGAFFDDHL